jgi:muramoyltetrapeptide carboxypeptidase
VAIIAPAGPLRDIKQADEFEKKLIELGFVPVMGENVKSKTGFFSAMDSERKKELEKYFLDPEVKAIIGIKGGWGCARLLPILDYELIKSHPKILMGFSDITALLNGITLKTGLITYHGPVGTATWYEYSLNYIKNVLMKGEKTVFKSTSDFKTLTKGTAEGILFGGNLSVLSGLVGTDYFPDPKGKILFLEDVEEEPFRIDRMLTHMKLAGIFSKLNGIIIGKFRDCEAEEHDFSFTVEEVLDEHFSNFHIPVYRGANIGHIRDKFTVPIGINAKMYDENCMFELTESPVKLD